MTIPEMRSALKNTPKYRKSLTWPYKVDNMSSNQVIAVYFRFKKEGLL